MSDPRGGSGTPSKPLAVPMSSSPREIDSRGRSLGESYTRRTSTARLTSPIPQSQAQPIDGAAGSPSIRQIPTPSQLNGVDSESQTSPLPGKDFSSTPLGPGQSALAAALRGSHGASPPRFGTPPLRTFSPPASTNGNGPIANFGSFDTRSAQGPSAWSGSVPIENPEIVKRHLVQNTGPIEANTEVAASGRHPFALGGDILHPTLNNNPIIAPGLADDEFSSLQLQGGDITRQVYRWTEEAEAQSQGRGQRSRSFHMPRPQPESHVLDINSIKIPGGFRRNYLRRVASPSPSSNGKPASVSNNRAGPTGVYNPPKMLTNNFLEFLSLYGHFAGEELEEDDEVLGPDEYFSSNAYDGPGDFYDGEEHEPGENSRLLEHDAPGKKKRRRKDRGGSGTNTSWGAFLLLLKSFVGTGVLFLPKAYLNGGMLFSNLILLFVASLSYYCFVLLVKTRLKVEGSFGDIGGILYGKWMRAIILFSIVLSQIGFASAYIVFTSENLQAFVLAVSDCQARIDIKLMILMQLIIFLPLSLIRDISKLGGTALVADAFILLGLVYLYYYDIFTIVKQHGVADIIDFNAKDWTLFIGTAIFTFEGIGLIIPIQESMKNPSKFPRVLGVVMIIITVVFISMGALSYAAYGSSTRTVVILNLPQDDKFVNAVQFLYSLAILLSTPLQLFPAIRITENELFTRSGKFNPYIKWQKNIFRFLLVLTTAAIAWGGAGDLDKFVALVGSFACVPLVYVYPPLLHLKAVATARWQKWADVALCIFGLVVMGYTTTLTIQSWASGSGSPTLGYCD
ncbi:MAG: neutral amino acid transporter [Trizodia sp. TS-e1964]|nr:MAG: neutral amino acid transporter [Trizodia sp. TS-e1964]